MKKQLLFILLLPAFALAQSTDLNYLKTITYKVEGSANPQTTVTYFDGLGRPIQKVDNVQSNTGKDIITHIEYDVFGRQVKEFLPYPTSQTTMLYIDDATANSATSSYYQGVYDDANPYGEKLLEASPLNRVLKQAAPGNSWAMGSGHEIKFDYQTNTATEVKFFKATATWSAAKALYDISITNTGNYAEHQLYKTVTKDENWTSGNNNTTQEFKDKEGRVVLKRTFGTSVVNGTFLTNEKHDTFYVYDQYGNLTYVIPPAANAAIDDITINGLCYQYKYDDRNRLAAKKLPGRQWEYIVYDELDRPMVTGPVFSPLGNGIVGILITNYDAFGRVIQTGWKPATLDESNRATIQNSINTGDYTNENLRPDLILTKNYYDSYSFSGAPPVSAPYATNVKGLQTGSWVKVLDPENLNAEELSYTLYDYKYRPIVNHTTNHLGGYTRVETTLDWIGKTLQTLTKHKRLNADTELTVKDIFEYTPQDRLLLHKQQIDNLPEQLITKNTYDELGQLISKNVGGEDATGAFGLQKVDYTYNIRGWLKEINNIADLNEGNVPTDLFAFKLNYNEHTDIGSNDIAPSPLYNGNISETYWRTNNDNVIRKYNYTYDELNRLSQADYHKPFNTSSLNNYKEDISYDKNGNIHFLLRAGDLDSDGMNNENFIDDLVYTYHDNNKNQLMKVLDRTNSSQGFSDDSDGITDTTDDYQYDANGNMISDTNKRIANISYNHLNLPVAIKFENSNSITYLYNAIGQKVRKIVTEGSSIMKTDYLSGGFQYKEGILQFFPHAEGFVNNTEVSGSNNYNYVFNYTDHLGNIRLSYGEDPKVKGLKIIEENHYYPFGLKHTNYNSDANIFQPRPMGVVLEDVETSLLSYKYKYNGKELQDELGLNMYDYGARNYDPAIGRWMNIDPLSEISRRFSPFAYALNNPIFFIDPDGMTAERNNGVVYRGGHWSDSIREANQSSGDGGDEGNGGGDPPSKNRLDEIVTVKGKKYHKNTSNLFAKIGNTVNSLFGGDSDYFVEHKPYDPAEENMLNETINTGVGFVAGGYLAKGIGNLGGSLMSKAGDKLLKFAGDEAVVHFGKHGRSIMNALGKDSYNLKNYLVDANYTVQNGTFIPQLNGFVRLIGGEGSAKFAFVGINRATGSITTFHIKTAQELAKKVPSMFGY